MLMKKNYYCLIKVYPDGMLFIVREVTKMQEHRIGINQFNGIKNC